MTREITTPIEHRFPVYCGEACPFICCPECPYQTPTEPAAATEETR